MPKVPCPYCNKKLKSQHGLEMHLKQSTLCQHMKEQVREDDSRPFKRPKLPDLALLQLSMAQKHALAAARGPDSIPKVAAKVQVDKNELQAQNDKSDEESLPQVPYEGADYGDFDPFNATDDEGNAQRFGTSSESSPSGEEDSSTEEPTAQPHIIPDANNASNKQFKEYCRHAFKHFGDLTKTEESCIRIMHKLYLKRATLDTYDAVMEWHLRESGKLKPYQSLGDSRDYVSRNKLMQKLRKRYNMNGRYAKPVSVLLPYTNTKVNVCVHHARDLVQSILTDPRWKDEDWLFFNDNPFAPP